MVRFQLIGLILPAIAHMRRFCSSSVTNKCRFSTSLKITTFGAVVLFVENSVTNRLASHKETTDDKQIICAELENSCSACSEWRISRSEPAVPRQIVLYACLMMNVPLYGLSIGKSILLKLKQYRVVLILRAKSKWGGFDTSLPDSSLPSNDTLSILALHW